MAHRWGQDPSNGPWVGQAAWSATAIASTASSGATFASMASRAASTASIRRSVASGDDPPATAFERPPEIGVDQIDLGTELQDQHVAVERREVDQRPVERVALGPGGPGALALLQVGDRTGRRPRGLATPRPPMSPIASRSAAFSSPSSSRSPRPPLPSRPPPAVAAAAKQPPIAADLGRELEHLATPASGLGIDGQPPGPADVPLRSPRRERRPSPGRSPSRSR